MKVIGYVRVITDKQDVEKQKENTYRCVPNSVWRLLRRKGKGKALGRPKGSCNKERVLEHLSMGLNLAAIMKIINPQLEQPITHNLYRYFAQREKDLYQAWQAQKQASS